MYRVCDVYETQRINGTRVIPAVYCSFFLILKSRNHYYMYDFVTKHYIPPLMGCQPNKMRKEKKELKLQRMSIYRPKGLVIHSNKVSYLR